jgi:hypothetical protein
MLDVRVKIRCGRGRTILRGMLSGVVMLADAIV